jgi:actin-related protein
MWGRNNWTKLMFERYWIVILAIFLVSMLIIFNANNFI